MSAELNADGQPFQSPEELGLLKRSEINLLSRHAKQYPLTGDDRAKAVEAVRKVMTANVSPRTKLSAVKCLAILDRLNIARDQLEAGSPASVNIHLHQNANELSAEQLAKLPADELIRRHRESLGVQPEAENPPAEEA